MNYIYTDNDFATEPVRGLPAHLPVGEHILWQGAPNWWAFARDVYKVRGWALIVALAAVTRLAASLSVGTALGIAVGEGLFILALGTLGLTIFAGLAWLSEKTTVYTITNRRVILRVGVALQKTFNIPFAQIDGAALRKIAGDKGSICLKLRPGVTIAYALIWPHARPWHLTQSQPCLRGLSKCDEVAQLLSAAFTTYIDPETDPKEALSASLSAPSTGALEDESKLPEPQAQSTKVGKVPVAMAFGIAFLALAFVTVHQVAKFSQTPGSTVARVADLDLEILFLPQPGDRLAVVEASGTGQITTIEPGTDGLLRGALRGFNRVRDARGLDPDAPFKLVRYEGDGTYLADPESGQDVRLDSFGPFDSGAVADLMAFGL